MHNKDKEDLHKLLNNNTNNNNKTLNEKGL